MHYQAMSARRKLLRDTMHARLNAPPKEQVELHKLEVEQRREYTVGAYNVILIPWGGIEDRPHLYIQHRTGISNLDAMTTEGFRALLQISIAMDEWIAGKRPAMPPSGPWKVL